jgi:HNH endonuclease
MAVSALSRRTPSLWRVPMARKRRSNETRQRSSSRRRRWVLRPSLGRSSTGKSRSTRGAPRRTTIVTVTLGRSRWTRTRPVCGFGRISLDPISGSIVYCELERIERQFFEHDAAEAKERLGRTPRLDELDRTPAQRRADALVEMATRSRTAPADGIRPAPLFSVFVGYESLHGRMCELENGTVLSPTTLLPWMDSAYFERAIFAPGNRVEVSVRSRLFSGGTRRAIELRDRTCTHPYCSEAVERCQGDHIEPFAEGGETTQDNGRLLCGFHNRLRNQRPPPDT